MQRSKGPGRRKILLATGIEANEDPNFCQDFLHDFFRSLIKFLGMARPPIQTYYLIGQDCSRCFAAFRNPYLKRVAFDMAGQWTEDG